MMNTEHTTSSAYRVHHTRLSANTLRQMKPYQQRTIENALAAIARNAPAEENLTFAGGMLLCGHWIGYALDHDSRVLSVLTIELDAEALLNRPIPAAA